MPNPLLNQFRDKMKKKKVSEESSSGSSQIMDAHDPESCFGNKHYDHKNHNAHRDFNETWSLSEGRDEREDRNSREKCSLDKP